MPPSSIAPPRLLVVDDDPSQRFLCREALEAAGFEVMEASDGESALDVFAGSKPDAILMDVLMPGIDGFATCSRIRAREVGRITPILMVTGLDDVRSIERAYTVGATDFISKPLNWTILVQRVRYMLRANQTLDRLRLSERRLATAERIARLGAFIARPGMATVECSTELLRLLGREDDPSPPTVRSLLRLMPRMGRIRLHAALRSTVDTGPVYQTDFAILVPGHPRRSVAVRIEIVQDADGGLSAHGTLQDITDRKRIEAELERALDEAQRAEEAKTVFMANMSHELRTPLNAIIGFSGLISSETFGSVGNPKYREYAADIEKAGQHMNALVENILTLARLEADHYALAVASCDLKGVVQSAVGLFTGTELARGRDIRLVNRLGWPVIEADERAIRQMVLNLLSNAVKFSADEAPVEVVCTRGPSGDIRLTVIDHGIGMTRPEAETALEPFRQVEGVLTRRHDGAGLGLSITSKLIKLHGGTIEIDSTPGVGTRVTLNFPAELELPTNDGNNKPVKIVPFVPAAKKAYPDKPGV